MTSEAKIAANRRNAQRSTGPHTARGKAHVRRNALQHGLAAVVVGDLDSAAEVDRVAATLFGPEASCSEREQEASGPKRVAATRSTSAAESRSPTTTAARPCCNALRRTCALPRAVWGPVLRCALRRLAAILASEVMCYGCSRRRNVISVQLSIST